MSVQCCWGCGYLPFQQPAQLGLYLTVGTCLLMAWAVALQCTAVGTCSNWYGAGVGCTQGGGLVGWATRDECPVLGRQGWWIGRLDNRVAWGPLLRVLCASYSCLTGIVLDSGDVFPRCWSVDRQCTAVGAAITVMMLQGGERDTVCVCVCVRACVRACVRPRGGALLIDQ